MHGDHGAARRERFFGGNVHHVQYARREPELDGQHVFERGRLQCVSRHDLGRTVYADQFVAGHQHQLQRQRSDGGCDLLLRRDRSQQQRNSKLVFESGFGYSADAVTGPDSVATAPENLVNLDCSVR